MSKSPQLTGFIKLRNELLALQAGVYSSVVHFASPPPSHLFYKQYIFSVNMSSHCARDEINMGAAGRELVVL